MWFYRSNWFHVEAKPLPEPLAEPKFEVRVKKATASAYHVKAGEYIQIIDVEVLRYYYLHPCHHEKEAYFTGPLYGCHRR